MITPSSQCLQSQNLVFNIYNRYGQLVFHILQTGQKMDGTINGYVTANRRIRLTLNYTDGDTGQKVFKRTTVLIR